MKRSLSQKKRRETPEGESDRRAKSVKWDEANLEENDKLKAELNPRKIDEPKTPYHGPLDSDEELSIGEAGMAPLTLEDDAAFQNLVCESNGTSAASSREDPERPNGWSDSDRGQSPGAISNSHSHSHSAHSGPSASGGGGGGEECSSRPGQGGERQSREKRRRFEARRKQHYNMRDALQRGKELLSREPDPGEAKRAAADHPQ